MDARASDPTIYVIAGPNDRAIQGIEIMIRPENDQESVTQKAQAAFLDVRQSVIDRARQTQTPIIVFSESRIQRFTADEFERVAVEQASERSDLYEGE